MYCISVLSTESDMVGLGMTLWSKKAGQRRGWCSEGGRQFLHWVAAIYRLDKVTNQGYRFHYTWRICPPHFLLRILYLTAASSVIEKAVPPTFESKPTPLSKRFHRLPHSNYHDMVLGLLNMLDFSLDLNYSLKVKREEQQSSDRLG